MLNRETNGRLAGQNSSAKNTKKVRNLFQNFVERVSVGVSITDEEGRIIFWNPAMERTTGLSADGALGRLIWEMYFSLLPPEMKTPEALGALRAKFLPFLTSGISDERDHKLELIYNHPGGAQFVGQGIIYSLPTLKGYCLLSILYDDVLQSSTEEVLKTSEEKFRNVVEQAGDGIVVLDAQEVILEWNDGCEKISGIDREHALGMHLTDLVPELFQGSEWTLPTPELTLHDQALRYLSLVARTGLPRVIEGIMHHSSGRRKWIQAVTFPIRAGDTLLFGVIARDVSSLKQSEERLQRYNRQLETLRQAGLEISSELGLDALVWMIAPRAVELLNGTAMALYLHNTEKDILELALSLGDNQPDMEKFTQRGVGLAGRVWESSKSVLLEDFHTGRTADLSKSYWGKVAGTPLIWGNEFLGVVFVFSNQNFYENDLKILELFGSHAAAAIRNARLHQELSQLAVTDSLTGIYNRRHFFEMAEKEFHQAVRYKRPFSVIMFDLDLFKNVNDTFGHARGDEILQMVVQRCAALMRDADILGRYGGEEFVIALPETSAPDAVAMAERLRQELASRPVESESFPALVTASFGVATLTANVADLMELLNRADIALYHVKQAGRNRVILWDSDFHTEIPLP
jgi:diguanylate cyclase (GGDEF)-like protein/PAS domain S-box-containing protein